VSLATGTRLGGYEIIGLLGAGGMGQVYRARDTKLNRFVAIKVLPDELAHDSDRLARFTREAQTLAALNHPNIAHIHGLEETSGVVALVMELVEGEDLSALIKRGPMPLSEALPIARQIAEALEAAHEQGFVHRDLKPANVKVREDGTVKLLDFGLAKALSQDDSRELSGALANSPTVLASPAVTGAGVILGTAAYMAPEQARGKKIDRRVDIWAFGVVFYEMLTGQRLFEGESVAETLGLIFSREPDLNALPSTTPAGIKRIIGRCLVKDPRQRLRDAGDARLLIDDAIEGKGDPASGAVAPPAAVPATRSPWTPVAACAVVAIGAGLAGWFARRPAEAGPTVAEFSQVTDQLGVETTPSISPDGKSVVYAKFAGQDNALYVQRIGGRVPQRLSPAAPAHDSQPAFSPDGERIAFRSERDGGGIFLMSATGESVTRLLDSGFFPSWSPDGSEIVVSSTSFDTPTDVGAVTTRLTVVNVKTGQTRTLPLKERSLQPAWSPSGARIAYWTVGQNAGQRDIHTVAADGSDAASGGVAVTNDPVVDWSPAWAPDGKFLYFSSARGGTMNLWRAPIDEKSGRPLGEPVPMFTPSSWSGEVSFARDGSRFVFASLDYRSTIMRAPLDPVHGVITGTPAPVLRSNQPIRDQQLSPDGKWIAFTTSGVREDLFVASLDGTDYRRLTDDPYRDRGPGWSPDGSHIAFYSDRSGSYQIWMIGADGSGLRPMTQGNVNVGFPIWSPSGDRIVYGFNSWHFIDPTKTSSPAPPGETAAGLKPGERFLPDSWSPDGKRIAGLVLPVDGSTGSLGVYSLVDKRITVSGSQAGRWPWMFFVWLNDSRHLIARRPDGLSWLDADTGDGRVLLPIEGLSVGAGAGVSRDNRWVLYTETASEGDIWMGTLKP
jgi:Tol biopolymer transport system component